MNIYPPLLPAPGFPYLSAGKILPVSQPWGRGGGVLPASPASLGAELAGRRGSRQPRKGSRRATPSRLGWGAGAGDPALPRPRAWATCVEWV